ncbi:MAG: DUF1896 domain-containing protein [Prevotellaceae bacterium]|jgi:hypothetical protein|nr:DUF1896 domain-containing protein [Prevotellaceae bacterium]
MAHEKLTPSDNYQQLIFSYLQNYHPYMLEDKDEAVDVIVLRAGKAQNAYRTAAYNNESPLECEQAAMDALYAGLEFSPITYLIEACINATGFEMNNDEACEIYRNQTVKEIFQRYGTEIEGDPREYLLVAELAPFFEQYKDRQQLSEQYF